VTESYATASQGTANGFPGQPTVSLDGIDVFSGTRAQALQACFRFPQNHTGARIATANLDFFALLKKDPALRDDLRSSSLVIADGMPVVWLGKLAGARRMQRLAGVDLVAEFFCTDLGRPLRVAIYGSTFEVASAAAARLHSLGAGARIVHTEHPPFREVTPAELSEAIDRLRAAEPDVVFVALGCPRQERFIAEHFQQLPNATWVGIGGSLDFFAGIRRRAPGVVQRAGGEWIMRMVQEPRRLGKRYLGRDIPAFVQLTAAVVKGSAN
jgi:N-acetylglucosaminyldiphosphoundecaprenol N-acetyl-beta-D-mannosaminyltransferase